MKNKMIWMGIIGALAVILGAFGAHSLKSVLPVDRLAIYETGVRYQFYHVLAMCASVILYRQNENKWFSRAFWFFVVGIILFSGSLYLLAIRDLIGLTTYKWLGPLTPIGGLFFILGWLSITTGGIKLNK